MKRWVFAGGIVAVMIGAERLAHVSAAELGTMAVPAYTEDGALVRPDDYRDWIFVGASLGLSYSENVRTEGPGRFHHVYVQPEAFEFYKANGEFPEKTMLVMENYSAGSKVSPNLQGHFQDKRVGVEVALKDSDQFEERWAYFNFTTANGLSDTAKAFPKAICYDCHRDHAAVDNTFVQFYPILREANPEAMKPFEEKESNSEETEG